LRNGPPGQGRICAVDAAFIRRGKLPGILAALVVNLFLALALLLVVLRWRGFL